MGLEVGIVMNKIYCSAVIMTSIVGIVSLLPHEMRMKQNKKPVLCNYNGKYYLPGEYQLSQCVHCNCSQTGVFKCRRTKCTAAKNPECIRYEELPGACCPQCVEWGCWHNGTGYPRGAKISVDACQSCFCPWESDKGPDPVCMKHTCSQPKCVDAVVRKGQCCPTCPNGINCWLGNVVIPAGRSIQTDFCNICFCPNEQKVANPKHRKAKCAKRTECFLEELPLT